MKRTHLKTAEIQENPLKPKPKEAIKGEWVKKMERKMQNENKNENEKNPPKDRRNPRKSTQAET